ncbi:MAG: hypothetical protein ACLP5V_07440 [Candidatus Bathyarchaeia archaeon]
MNNGQKVIVVAVLIAMLSGYGWGWTIRPQLRYELLSQTNYDYCGFGPPTPPLNVQISVDNLGVTTLVTDVTLSAINATISTSQIGSFGTSATARLLIRPKDSFAWSFYVIHENQTNSFKVFISNVQSVYGLDSISSIVYFAYSTSIYQPLNPQSLTYVGSSCNFSLQSS